MSTLRVRRWTSEEFFANRAQWQELLARSDADPLFLCWDWSSAWWRHHDNALNAQLCVLGIYDGESLCGIAPFYLHRAAHRRIFAARRLELLGNTWRDSRAIFSEYLDLIAARSARAEVCAAISDWLRGSREWDELLLCNLRPGSIAAQLAGSLGDEAYVRSVDSLTGWSVALPASFESFTAQLSSNSRRKIVHQREKLDGLTFESTPVAQRPAVLARLETFVSRRFRAPAGQESDLRARFHADLIEHGAYGDNVRLTELRAGGACISVMLNLRVGGTEYYLQSGFDDAHARGVSPGLLHLGFAIEAACRDGIGRFDFLAGPGLNRDYKQDFAAQGEVLHCLHVVRKPSLRMLFRIFDRARTRRASQDRADVAQIP